MSSIAVISPKGGVGVSLIAVNLALHLQEYTLCLLLDLHGPLQVDDLLLNVDAQGSWEELLPLSLDLNPVHLRQISAPHPSGLRFLGGSLSGADICHPERVTSLFCALEALVGRLVFDCPNGFHPLTQLALSMSEIVLLVATPDPPALRACSRFLNLLDPSIRTKIGLILNQVSRPHPAQAAEIAKRLCCPLLMELVVDHQAIGEQVHFGRTSSTYRNSPFRNALHQLARSLD